MKQADYSGASTEEREEVIAILQRNVNQLIEQKQTSDPEMLRQYVDQLCHRVRNGEIISGQDFQALILLFQKKSFI
ncbi:MAG: hypothetical protein ACE5HS_07945 [bacterium]